MRIVADTNTVISGLLWKGAPRQIIQACRQQRITIVSSESLIAELAEVLARDKPVCRDPDDDAVLACAVTGRVDALISGDDDLLTLKVFRAIPIMTAAEWVRSR